MMIQSMDASCNLRRTAKSEIVLALYRMSPAMRRSTRIYGPLRIFQNRWRTHSCVHIEAQAREKQRRSKKHMQRALKADGTKQAFGKQRISTYCCGCTCARLSCNTA